jgi:RNA polymerase sigma-54 factor
MKLLQVPTANLETRIKEELEENPALELEEENHDEYDESKDEFAENGEEEYKEPDGSEDEYGNIDISDYVRDGDDDIADYKLRDDNYPEEDEGRQLPHKSDIIFFRYVGKPIGIIETG